MSMIANKLRVAFLSSFTPRECGIATFTRDLVDSIDRERTLNHSVVVAVNEKGAHYNYDHRARALNQEKTTSIQHHHISKPSPQPLTQDPRTLQA